MPTDISSDPSPIAKVLFVMSSKVWPYVELIRLNKPVAILNFAFPAIFGLLLCATTAIPIIRPSQLVRPALLLLFASIMTRCIACAFNDILDQDVDRKVSRTRSRPMARGAISTSSGLICTALLIALDVGILQTYSTESIAYNIIWILTLCIYPVGKRITDYTSISLGFGISWGVLVAFPILGIDVWASPSVSTAAAFLASSHAMWMMGQDLIYDFQDLRDDKAIGNGSMAVRYERNGHTVLAFFTVLQLFLLAATGLSMDAGRHYYLLALGGTTGALGLIYGRAKLSDPNDCAVRFKAGAWLVPVGSLVGLLAEYLVRLG